MAHAPTSWVRYLLVWIALLALTVLSFAMSLLHLGTVDVAVALVIAVVKTALVLLFFMHLIGERFSTMIMPLLAAFFMLLLLGLVITDVRSRMTFPKAPAPYFGPPQAE